MERRRRRKVRSQIEEEKGRRRRRRQILFSLLLFSRFRNLHEGKESISESPSSFPLLSSPQMDGPFFDKGRPPQALHLGTLPSLCQHFFIASGQEREREGGSGFTREKEWRERESPSLSSSLSSCLWSPPDALFSILPPSLFLSLSVLYSWMREGPPLFRSFSSRGRERAPKAPEKESAFKKR